MSNLAGCETLHETCKRLPLLRVLNINFEAIKVQELEKGDSRGPLVTVHKRVVARNCLGQARSQVKNSILASVRPKIKRR
jgi:hypothetical protein